VGEEAAALRVTGRSDAPDPTVMVPVFAVSPSTGQRRTAEQRARDAVMLRDQAAQVTPPQGVDRGHDRGR